jgi:hypothetical protein
LSPNARPCNRSLRPRRRGMPGQGMVEFAVVAPLFFFVLLAAINGGLVMYLNNAASQSAAIGMITLANEGNAALTDKDAITQLKAAGIGTTSLGKLDEVDIFHVFVCDPTLPSPGTVESPSAVCSAQPAGTIITDASRYNRYNPAPATPTCIVPCTWLPTARSESLSSLSNVGIQLKYHFDYLGLGNVHQLMTQTRYFRLEPQQP